MSLTDLGEKVEKSINVEIGNKYYYRIGKSETYSVVTITGKRFYPDDRTDNGFVYTNPTNTLAVGKLIDPVEINKFFRISTRKYNETEYIEQKNAPVILEQPKSDIFEQVKQTEYTKVAVNEKFNLLNSHDSAPVYMFSGNPVPGSPEEPIQTVSFQTKLPSKNILSPIPELVTDQNKKYKNLLR